MIEIDSSCVNVAPLREFKRYYDKALNAKESNIDVMALSTIDCEAMKPRSRYVNLKYIKKNKFIFFSNYLSDKGKEISNCNQVSCLFYWNSIYTQIRIEGNITKSSASLSDSHFEKRELKKNALSISSKQSKKIQSFEVVMNQYNEALSSNDLFKRPSYWGGYSITPYYFEFWEGHKNRLNRRKAFSKLKNSNKWSHFLLSP
jgi:pyridoxamine 5'-phosphate oxidase